MISAVHLEESDFLTMVQAQQQRIVDALPGADR